MISLVVARALDSMLDWGTLVNAQTCGYEYE